MKHCLIGRGSWGKVLEGPRGYLGVGEKCCHHGHTLLAGFCPVPVVPVVPVVAVVAVVAADAVDARQV